MFSGKAYHNIDDKGRLFIPAAYREELADGFRIGRGFSDPYLIIYPEKEWQSLNEKMDAQGFDKTTRAIKRYINMNASPLLETDSQGRIVVSKEHREYANLLKEVVIVGMGNTLEIWDAKVLSEQTNIQPDNLEDFLALLR